jgi:hypothetical protein
MMKKKYYFEQIYFSSGFSSIIAVPASNFWARDFLYALETGEGFS